MSRLVAENISIARGGRAILDAVNFSAAPGEIVGVLGPNGAGKTSLLRVLAGLDTPKAGRVLLDGKNAGDLSAHERARLTAFLPQPAEAAWPVAVEHLVGLGRLPFAGAFRRMSPADIAAIERALDATDLQTLRHRAITTLSAGEAARAFLARALAGEPRLLLADEPTANLDPAHQLAAMNVLRSLADSGATVVMAQHDLSLAGRFCDRLVLLGKGGVTAEGRPGEVLTQSNLAATFGIVARYPDNPEQGFFAIPWSLVADETGHDMRTNERSL